MEVLANVMVVVIILQHVFQINKLYTLKLQNALCQLYLNKPRGKKRLSPKNQMSWSLHHNKITNITSSFGTKSDQPANTSSKRSLYGVNKISLRENKENF